MDKVYTNFLSRKGKENTLSHYSTTLKEILPFGEIENNYDLNITEIDSKHVFISNTESKGFLVERSFDCPEYEFCSLYKNIVKSVGCIKELYNFLKNIMYYKVKLKMKNNKEEIKLLNIQLITSLIVIVTVTISLILTYNQKLNLKNKKTIFNKKQTHNISYINRLTILITSIVFLLINYKLYQISKKEGEDLLVYNLQIIASILTTIASIIVFYVVSIEPAGDEISDIENPVI